MLKHAHPQHTPTTIHNADSSSYDHVCSLPDAASGHGEMHAVGVAEVAGDTGDGHWFSGAGHLQRGATAHRLHANRRQEIPKGPSTNMMRTLCFYIVDYKDGLGQLLLIQVREPSGNHSSDPGKAQTHSQLCCAPRETCAFCSLVHIQPTTVENRFEERYSTVIGRRHVGEGHDDQRHAVCVLQQPAS